MKVADYQKEIEWLKKEKEELQEKVGVLEMCFDSSNEENEALRDIINEIDLYFESGNDIPVDRVTIMRKDWLTIKEKSGNIV